MDTWDDEEEESVKVVPTNTFSSKITSKPDESWDDDDDDGAGEIVKRANIAVPFSIASLTNKSNWDDEDPEENTNVKEAWDEDEEKLNQSSSNNSSTVPIKKQQNLRAKISVNKEEEEEEPINETPAERKARLHKQVVESDFENAKDLFGDNGENITTTTTEPPPRPSPPAAATLLSNRKIQSMNPNRREEFDLLRVELTKLLYKFEKRGTYPTFVELLTRDLCVAMDPVAIRKISTSLNTLATDKEKALKVPVIGNKKPMGPKVGSSKKYRDDMDLTNYDDDIVDEYDDDDDIDFV